MIFTVANLGDAALTILTNTAVAGGTVGESGLLFVANSTGSPITLTLDTELTPFLMIKDTAGNAGSNPITIFCSAGIDAGTSFTLAVPYQSVWLAWNGASYSIIG